MFKKLAAIFTIVAVLGVIAVPALAAGAGGLELPITEKPLQLRMWAQRLGSYRGSDYNEKVSFQEMEKRTNIKMDFEVSTGTGYEEQFNLMMASQDLPDLILYAAWDKHAANYGHQGALLPLEDLIAEHAPNFSRILEEYPELRGQITAADGHIYYMPNLALEGQLLVQMYPQIRFDWLEKLGLEEPVTTEDWYHVLKAFKEQDVNGNGIDDEVPFVAVNISNLMMMWAPAWGFNYQGAQTGFFIEDGVVKYSPYEDRFVELLEFLNRLYAEGLLDPTYASGDYSTNYANLREKVVNDVTGAWVGWAGSFMNTFRSLKADDPDFWIGPISPPKGPHGHQWHISARWQASGIGIAVASTTKHPVEAIKWLDYQYSEEGILLNNFGVEGVSYDMVDGYPKFKPHVFDNPDGLSPEESLLQYVPGGGSWATVSDGRYLEQYNPPEPAGYTVAERVAPYVNMSRMLPPVQFTPEEQRELAPIMMDLTTFVEENVNNFILGRRPLSEFGKFQESLKKMQVEKVLSIYQDAYDRFMSY